MKRWGLFLVLAIVAGSAVAWLEAHSYDDEALCLVTGFVLQRKLWGGK